MRSATTTVGDGITSLKSFSSSRSESKSRMSWVPVPTSITRMRIAGIVEMPAGTRLAAWCCLLSQFRTARQIGEHRAARAGQVAHQTGTGIRDRPGGCVYSTDMAVASLVLELMIALAGWGALAWLITHTYPDRPQVLVQFF